MIAFIVLFPLGLMFGVLWFSMVLLPLFYAVPKSLLWKLRGWVGWGAPLRYFLGPMIISGLIVGALLLVLQFAPSVATWLQNGAFNFGVSVGVLLSVGRVLFSAVGRADVRADFVKGVLPSLTEKGLALLRQAALAASDSEASAGSLRPSAPQPEGWRRATKFARAEENRS